jgi:nucleotide-binding universal stress UspA family protein
MAVSEVRQDTTETKRLSVISVKNVLYATDFSTTSEAALPYAAAVCRKFGSTLHIAHVISDTGLLLMTGGVDYVSFGTLYEDTNTVAKQKMDVIASCLRGLPFRTHFQHGKVWPQLKQLVAQNEIDLIVVGTHGRGGISKLLVGSVAENILRHAPCPVLTVGPAVCGHARLPQLDTHSAALAPSELELQHILYAAKLTPESQRVAQVAIALAQQFEARLTVMHVIEYPVKKDVRLTLVEETRERLEAMVPLGARLPYAPEAVAQFGSAWQAIVKEAAERGADLIVLGARASEGTTHMPWSTVHHVVADATCPVLTVRA